MLRRSLLALSRSRRVENLVTTLPVSSGIVARFVAGKSTQQAVAATADLARAGLAISLDHLGEDTLDREQASRGADAYLHLLGALAATGLTPAAEVSLKLSAVGQAIGADGEAVALDNASRICEAARDAGTTVTLDMEDHATTDSTLGILAAVRQDFPETGAVLQALLHRTEADCKDLAHAGSRVRLCKGAYNEPEQVAYQSRRDVDQSYVRCLKVLMNGAGYPMVATHDPRLLRIAAMLAERADRQPDTYEYQMLYGVRPEEQKRIAADGHTMRVYVPYGDLWYGYLVRRLAERPQNVAFFARSLATKG